ncbi:hypothetical protein FACS189493_1710 [Spirochaetia bacterium]|nr:hypothetical protein FACS189493_1710 [Spirochaetia bacterium]
MNKPRLIATLTSYPARIGTVHITINSLLQQNLKADLVVLYLGYDKFPNKEDDLPEDLVAQTNQGLSIHWVKDIGCFTTLVPALLEFPDDVIINVDDDIDYSPKLFESLYNSYLKDTASIHSTVAHRILFDKKNCITLYNRWGNWHGTKEPSYHNFIISTLGTLYPPRSLHTDVLNLDVAYKLTPSNDDIWFWTQALRKGTRIRVAEEPDLSENYIEGTQDVGLVKTNSMGINDDLLQNVLTYYPEIYDILNTEPLKIVPRIPNKVLYLLHIFPLVGFRNLTATLFDIFLFNFIFIPFIKIEKNNFSYNVLFKCNDTIFYLIKVSDLKNKKIYSAYRTDNNLPPVSAKSSTNPLISVVIPASNRSDTIARTINSVLKQTYRNFEILVIDDGSTDTIKEVLDSFNNVKIKYFYQENSGANRARNLGIERSSGAYISFLDSDDTWDETYLEKVLDKFRSDDEIGFVWTHSRFAYPDANKYEDRKTRHCNGFVYKKVLKQGYLTSCSFISAKKTTLQKIGGYDERFKACQDDDICFRLCKNTKTGEVNEVLGSLFINPKIERISNNNERMADAWFSLWEKYAEDVLKLCGKRELTKKYFSVYRKYRGTNNKQKMDIVYSKMKEQFGFGFLIYFNLYKFLYYCKGKSCG